MFYKNTFVVTRKRTTNVVSRHLLYFFLQKALLFQKVYVILRRNFRCINILTNLINKKEAMIVVPVKEGENIERALKKFKRKFERTGIVKELRARQQFDKPSVLKRLAMERAVYVQKLRRVED